ncbi:MAG: hypothetical protein NTV39_04605 [Candidatus Saccharibacteria bacterium]|nr:hypothetical protein [Candidatus Saccharibacteria bacterium]
MRFLEPTANPLWMKSRRGRKPATKAELRQMMSSMVWMAKYIDLGKPEGEPPQVVKCHFDDVLIEANGKSIVAEMIVKYYQDHVELHTV